MKRLSDDEAFEKIQQLHQYLRKSFGDDIPNLFTVLSTVHTQFGRTLMGPKAFKEYLIESLDTIDNHFDQESEEK